MQTCFYYLLFNYLKLFFLKNFIFKIIFFFYINIQYVGRGLMKKFNSGADLAQEMGIKKEKLAETFAIYNK